MKLMGNETDIYAEDDLFEDLEENQGFNEFIGKCLSHFIHFVVPRRDQDSDIAQEYEIPESVDNIPVPSVILTRETGNKVTISYSRWRD